MKILNVLKEKVMEKSRAKKEDQFYDLFKEVMTVLDFGVSSETKKKGLPGRNSRKHLKYFV